MKAIPLLLAAIMFAWLAPMSPADDGTGTASTPTHFGAGNLPAYIALYDVNQNGILSEEELQALETDKKNRNRRQRFKDHWDTNRDGILSNTEITEAQNHIRIAIEQRRCDRFDEVDVIDKQGADRSDGFLSRAEFGAINAVQVSNANRPGLADTLFDHLDRNDDNYVSKAEFLHSLSVTRSTSADPEAVPAPHSNQRVTNPGN